MGFEHWHEFEKEDSRDIDAIFVLNNHPNNLNLRIDKWLTQDKAKLFFDGGCQFSHLQKEEKMYNLSYNVMGKIGDPF